MVEVLLLDVLLLQQTLHIDLTGLIELILLLLLDILIDHIIDLLISHVILLDLIGDLVEDSLMSNGRS